MEEQSRLPQEARGGYLGLSRPAEASPERAESDPRIEDYLDYVTAPLVGCVPYAERQAIREEIRYHLSALAEARGELGEDRRTAVREALRQFGDPRRIGRALKRASMRKPLLPVGPAFRAALIYFGLAVILSLTCIPESPVHDLRASPPLLTLMPPVVAGLMTGWGRPGRSALGSFHAMALLIALTGLLGGFLIALSPAVLLDGSRAPLPLSPRLLVRAIQNLLQGDVPGSYALFMVEQVGVWLPFGCIAAALGEWFREIRQRRMRLIAD